MWQQQGECSNLKLGPFVLSVWYRHNTYQMSLTGVIVKHYLSEAQTLEQARELALQKVLKEIMQPAYTANIDALHEAQFEKVRGA